MEKPISSFAKKSFLILKMIFNSLIYGELIASFFLHLLLVINQTTGEKNELQWLGK